MSRTRRRKGKVSTADVIDEGTEFPVNYSVCGAYLRKLKYVEKLHKESGKMYGRMQFSFNKKDKWVTKFLSNYPREYFSDKKSWTRNRENIDLCLQNLMACYLSGDQIRFVRSRVVTTGFRTYFDEMHRLLKEEKFWNKEVCIKTVPSRTGRVYVGKYAPFINLPHNKRWHLRYTKYELDLIAKLKVNE